MSVSYSTYQDYLNNKDKILYECVTKQFYSLSHNESILYILKNRVYITNVENIEDNIQIPEISYNMVRDMFIHGEVKYWIFNIDYQFISRKCDIKVCLKNTKNSILTIVDNKCHLYISEVFYKDDAIYRPLDEDKIYNIIYPKNKHIDYEYCENFYSGIINFSNIKENITCCNITFIVQGFDDITTPSIYIDNNATIGDMLLLFGEKTKINITHYNFYYNDIDLYNYFTIPIKDIINDATIYIHYDRDMNIINIRKNIKIVVNYIKTLNM